MVRVRQEFSLSLEYRELIMLRVAWLNKAEFEWNVHYPAYLDAGGTAEKAEALRLSSAPHIFNDTETLLIHLTDQSTRNVVVEENIIGALKSLLGEKRPWKRLLLSPPITWYPVFSSPLPSDIPTFPVQFMNKNIALCRSLPRGAGNDRAAGTRSRPG